MSEKKLMLVDGNSILNRGFYGLQGNKLLATSDGLYTNAVLAFINILYKYLEEEKPEYLCVAFDLRVPTFRHKEFEGYKAKRKVMPHELVVQVPIIKQVLDALNIRRLEYEGYEADDILGSISLCAEARGIQVIIITGDRDSLQLATETTRIKLPITRAGRTETEEYDYGRVVERYSVTPVQFIDVKGLMGDQSDNIPGVPGIGEKTAIDLIKKFGSIENVYDNVDHVDKISVKEKLLANRELAFMSKRLATIDRQMPHLCDVEDLKRGQPDQTVLYELFKRLEFKSLIEKFKLDKNSDMVEEVYIQKQVKCICDINELKALKEIILSSKEFSIYYFFDKAESFDIRLTGLSISWGDGQSSYISLCEYINEEGFLNEFRDIFEDGSILKFGHDLKGLSTYLKSKGIKLNGISFDTLIGAYIIDPSRNSYTISELMEEYFHVKIQSIESLAGKGKNYIPFNKIPVEKISQMAGAYSEAVLSLRKYFNNVMSENGQQELYYEIELPLVEVLSEMEYWGFRVNMYDLKSFSIELQEKISSLTLEIFRLAGEEFNINSTKQLGVILFEKLGLPALKKTKTGYSTDAEVLEQLSTSHEVVPMLLEYRQHMKLKSTYVEGLLSVINPNTGRIHSSFNQTVTATGRISSTEPNLQNIPIKLEMGRKIRKVFVPENSDYVLLDADYSQIELRILAHITNDENMISAFVNNEDIHTSTASRIFDVQMDSVTSAMRSRAKTVNFGIVYGIGEFSLSKDLGITRKEAKKYIDEYLDEYPRVRQYMHEVIEKGIELGYVTTLFNRRRYLPELKSSNHAIRSFGERMAMNTPIQGSAADIIKIAMVRVHRELKRRNMKSRLILQVHDELIIETFREEEEKVAAILKNSMENAAQLSVSLSVEVKSGNNWYETK